MTLAKQEIFELGLAKEQAVILFQQSGGMLPEVAACPLQEESADFSGSKP